MTTQQQRVESYEVVVWDYDATPDAAEYFSQDYTGEDFRESILPYYCHERRRLHSRSSAIDYARYMVEEKLCVGAAVFVGTECVYGIGVVFSYRAKYL